MRLIEENRPASRFTLSDLTTDQQDELYEAFRASYLKSVGVSWSKERFLDKAGIWVFYGDTTGGIALRHQHSGMYKLNAVYGGRQIIGGYTAMMSDIGSYPIWGMMTEELCHMLEKHSRGVFLQAPPLVMRVLFPVLNRITGYQATLDDATSAAVFTVEGVQMKKFLIGNSEYYKALASTISRDLGLPKPVVDLLKRILKSRGLIA